MKEIEKMLGDVFEKCVSKKSVLKEFAVEDNIEKLELEIEEQINDMLKNPAKAHVYLLTSKHEAVIEEAKRVIGSGVSHRSVDKEENTNGNDEGRKEQGDSRFGDYFSGG